MHQPVRFEDSQFPHHLCLLDKDLYSLKRAPQDWHHRLRSALSTHGFIASTVDTSLFLF
jgi:hypothetical protein